MKIIDFKIDSLKEYKILSKTENSRLCLTVI